MLKDLYKALDVTKLAGVTNAPRVIKYLVTRPPHRGVVTASSARLMVTLLFMTQLSACSFAIPAWQLGPYGEGYRAGCTAGEGSGQISDRDGIARTHLQSEYFDGWTAGFKTCRVRKADDQRWRSECLSRLSKQQRKEANAWDCNPDQRFRMN